MGGSCVRVAKVVAQAIVVELGEDVPRHGYVEPVRVSSCQWRSAREDRDPEDSGTYPDGELESSERDGFSV